MIKRIQEFFDNDDLKSQFEIPHMKGEMNDEINKWSTFSKPVGEETPKTFLNKIIFKYPVFKTFQSDTKVTDDGVEIFCFYNFSQEPCDGNEYYVQLVISYDVVEKDYFVNIVMRNINDYDDQSKWNRYDLNIKDIDKVYGLIESFLTSCIKLNVISPEQKSSLLSN